MKKQTRACMAMAMAVAMTTATISSVVPGNGITAEAASVRLSKTSLSLKVGQSKQLTVKGTKKTVKWSVSNAKIVKVTKKGKVTAKKAGSAKVYAKVSGKKLTCKVKVTAVSSKNATASPSISPTPTATIQTTSNSNTSSGSSTGSSSSSGSNSNSSSSPSKVTSTPTATTGAAMTPKATSTADETEEPTKTSKPGKTEGPEETKTPDQTKAPNETEAPEESVAPAKTKAPGKTESPEETKAPETTENPNVENLEIKVGEKQSATVDGIKFTYFGQEDRVIIKMENTTKSAKSVEVLMDLYDLEGNKVSDDTFFYNESISYLSAGKTKYGYVYNFSEAELSKYVVNSVEVASAPSYYADCLSEITASPEKGTDLSDVNITLEYTGDTSKIDGDGITVYGAIVYYDSKGNIVSVETIIEDIYPSDSRTTTVKGFFFGEADHYEVILSGARYWSDSDEPYNTDEPNETSGPEATPTPSVEPTEAPENEKVSIKVGETKTVKKDGIEFTFTTDEDGIIVQYKNTMNSGKYTYVTIDALNTKGELVTSYTHHAQYISAGKTFYSSMLYDGEKGEVASYEVSSLEVNDPNVGYGDCINNLTVTPAKGTDVERNEWTVEYNGDLSKVEGQEVHVEGSILYYNSDNRIIRIEKISKYIKFSSENKTGTLNGNSSYYNDEEDHYEVVLCGAEY